MSSGVPIRISMDCKLATILLKIEVNLGKDGTNVYERIGEMTTVKCAENLSS